MAKIYGQIEKAQLENLASNPSPTSTGLIYFNTVSLFPKVYNGTSWKTLVDDSTAQTISGKTLTAPIVGNYEDFTEVSTPATPSAGALRVFAKTDHNLYKVDSNGVESQVGSGGGSGGSKNYLGTVNEINGNGDFELGNTTGWSLAHSSLTSNFPSTVGTAGNSFSSAGGAHGGSAASGNLSIAVVSSGQLAGKYSLSYASSAASSAGDMVISDPFTIDLEDQAKVLTFKVYYKAQANASNGNFSGTSSNSFGFAIYDVTNAAWIMPAGVWNVVQSSGVGYATGTFQTTSNSTQYQLAWFNANASAGAITMYMDDFSVGPQTAPIGAAESDWQAYTPTINGGGSRSNEVFMWRRNGPNLEVVGSTIMGTTTATPMYFTLPPGLNIDSAKVGAGNRYKVGDANRLTSSSTSPDAAGIYDALFYNGTNTDRIYITNTISSGGYVEVNANSLFNNGEVLVFDVLSIPIAGWGTNTSVSSDTDTRVVASRYSTSAAQSISNGSTAIINFDAVDFDTHAAVTTGVSWKHTAPVTGKYKVQAMIAYASASFTAGNANELFLYKNGSLFCSMNTTKVWNTVSTKLWLNGAAEISLSAGDYIDVRTDHGEGSARSLSATATENWVSIERLSGPAVVAATETVSASYYASAGGTVSTSGPVNFDTKVFDTHAAVSASAAGTGSWTFKAPVTSKYHVSGVVANSAGAVSWIIYKNGSSYAYVGSANATNGTATNLSYTISLNAGDTIEIRTTNSQTWLGGTQDSGGTCGIQISAVK